MKSFADQIKEYARLAVAAGVNLQPGQTLVLECPVSAYEFGRQIAEYAYQAGAREVVPLWLDERMTRLKYEYAPLEAFEKAPAWYAHFMNDYAAENAAFLYVESGDPDLMRGVDAQKQLFNFKSRKEATKPYRKLFDENQLQWHILAVPNPAWAKKVFPADDTESGMAKLWQAIFACVRVDQGDALENWRIHDEKLRQRCQKLNALRLQSLHYRAANGTDLTIGLPEGHIWMGGADESAKGVRFFANMPTEEIFTTPHRTQVEGKAVASMPLSYQGNLIEDFSLTFAEGRVIGYQAGQGEEHLARLLETDAGSRYLGEVALVPYHSPISQMGILFYNTLFDENASCHLALGACYPNCIRGGERLDKKELEKLGGNDSLNHVDFMIGAPDLHVTGRKENGEKVTILDHGDWVLG